MSKKKTKYSVPIKNHLSLLQETWDRAFHEGYAKGRVRCLEQHRGEELRLVEETIRQKTIEEIKALNVGTLGGSIIIPLKSWKELTN